jgi:hypothetical protein
MIKLQGFAPDLDPTTPGILQSVTNALPTTRGMMGAPTPVNTIWILDGTSRGCATVETLSSGTKKYLAQGNNIFELTPSGLALRGTGYALTAGRIQFTTFGDAVILCSGAVRDDGTSGFRLTASTGSTFTSISSSPPASIIESVGLQVLAFDCDDGGDHHPDQWWASALGDYTNWTPSAATQAANGRLLDSAGRITAARRINDGIIAYKKRSMYYGQYVGGDVIWQWSQVATNIGCVGQDAVVNAGGVHYFVGADDLYMFDGSYPRSIGGNIKRWFFKDADPARIKNVIAVHDRNDDHVWFWYSSTTAASGFFDTAIVYNMLTGTWGRVSQLAQDVMTHQSGTDTLSIVGTSGGYYRVQTLSGACGAASMQTFDIGDDDRYSRLSKIRPRYLTSPTSATATHYHKTHAGLAYTTGTTDTMSDHKFNFSQSARWHKLKIDTVGNFEISGLAITESVQNGNK